MKTISALRAVGDSHPGLQREVNEDRFHVDLSRGLFIVVDGVGGQAAGGKAADLAMQMLRARLERETGTIADRVREAITIANNEIRRAAAQRTEWHGMACVLTVAVVDDGRAIVGHVGDTRLYKIRGGRIEKITRDHSPVGEREDAREISERQAMRHPRRNEVYRDVGSEPHEPSDADFIDLHEIPFEPDAALLMCSDGLTDLVDSATLRDVAMRFASRPHDVVATLIQEANDAGGKDNVTVVFVEGEQFAPTGRQAEPWAQAPRVPSRLEESNLFPADGSEHSADDEPRGTLGIWGRVVRWILVLLLLAVAGYEAYRFDWRRVLPARSIVLPPDVARQIVVTPSDSIVAAIAQVPAGGSVLVEPGEYRERVVLQSGVRVISRVPRGATIRLPSTASEGDPAIVADGISGAELAGFRIVGDAATPLGTGISIRNADVSVVDVEITGAARAAVDLGAAARLSLLASHIHDNPGSALAVRGGAAPRVHHNLFSRNGLSERVGSALIVERDTQPSFFANMFQGIAPDAFRALGDAAVARIARDNSFGEAHEPQSRPSSAPGGRRGR